MRLFLEGEKVFHKTLRVNFRNINKLYIGAALLDRLSNECLYQNFKIITQVQINCMLSVTVSLSEFIYESSINIVKDLLKFKRS